MTTLYISDLDGTLLSDQGLPDDETVATLAALKAAGHLFTVATARSPGSGGALLARLPLSAPAVMMNGVVLYDADRRRVVRAEYLDASTAAAALQIFREGGRLPYHFELDGQTFSVEYRRLYHPADRAFADARRALYRRFAQVEEYAPRGKTVYLAAPDRPEVLGPIVERLRRLPGVTVTFYQDHYDPAVWFCECFSSAAGKAAGARRAAAAVGADRLVAFGDNTNDLPLFAVADECYAVANAVESVKAAATGIIGANREQGVARWLQKSLKLKNFS